MTTTTSSPGVATAADIRAHAETPLVLTLPESGFTVRLKRLHILEIARQGVLPSGLAGLALSSLGIPGDKKQAPASVEVAAGDLIDLIDATCCAVLVEPRMTRDDPGPDEIQPGDLPFRDREAIYEVVCGDQEARDLHRFREATPRDVAAVEDSDGAGVPAE